MASGQRWWGRRTAKVPVVYINFELHRWSIGQRVNALCGVRPECTELGRSLALWNLRGRGADLTLLRPKLEEQLMRHQFGLIILDPAYKLLGDRDENANGEIASLMNEFEALAQSSGAAVVVAHDPSYPSYPSHSSPLRSPPPHLLPVPNSQLSRNNIHKLLCRN